MPRPVTSDDDVLRMPQPIITGEAVLLDLRPASFLTRALALGLDAVVQVVVGAGLLALVALSTSGLDDAVGTAASLAAGVTALVVLPTAWEAFSRGRSPGKAAAGLRVVRDDGGPVRARQAVVRALVGVGELWTALGSVAVIASLASPSGKRVGDLLAGTLVVRERSGARASRPLVAPPELAAWAGGADIGRLPEDLATSARALLDRADRLHPQSRERLLAEVCARFAALVAPPPPAGTPPERVIAAILAERRSRDLARLTRARERRNALARDAQRLQG